MKKANQANYHVRVQSTRSVPIIGLLVLGIAASFAIFWLVYDWEQTKQRSEFESRANAYSNAVESTLTAYIGALLFLGDFFNHSPPVTR